MRKCFSFHMKKAWLPGAAKDGQGGGFSEKWQKKWRLKFTAIGPVSSFYTTRILKRAWFGNLCLT